MQRHHSGVQLLAVLALLIIAGLSKSTYVSASSAAIVVYTHAFAKQVNWVFGHFVPGNKTSTFTQDDRTVYAYVTAAFYSANLTWNWYNPYGQLYESRTDQDQCVASPCPFTDSLQLAFNPPALMLGTWRMDLLANGYPLYSDYFSIIPVITQENYWKFDILHSAPGIVHGYLTVTIHPNNQTWSYYKFSMPYAANVTAHEASSNRTLQATFSKGIVIVNLGGARSDGYRFVVSFDVKYGLAGTENWVGGTFSFWWQEYIGDRFDDFHPVPETFNITLPPGATPLDVVGYNAVSLDNAVTLQQRPSITFNRTFTPGEQRFGWAIIYQDLTFRHSLNVTQAVTTANNFQLASGQRIPVLPLTLGGVSLWSAVMSVFMLTASELLSPVYARSGMLIDRRRLRIAALLLVAVFLIATAYQVAIYQASVPPPR